MLDVIAVVIGIASGRDRAGRLADRLLGTFAPLSVLLLPTAWVVQQRSSASG